MSQEYGGKIVLFSCLTVSFTTCILMSMYVKTKLLQFHEEFEQKKFLNHSKTVPKVAAQQESETAAIVNQDSLSIKNKQKSQYIIKLSSLSIEKIPKEFQLDTYFKQENRLFFHHACIFSNISHVFQLIDRIHPYLMDFFQHKRWVLNEKEYKNATIVTLPSSTPTSTPSHEKWILPLCVIDEQKQIEIILYPQVKPSNFCPDKIICLGSSINSSSPKHQLIVRSGQVLGGVFDLTDGSIYIGRNVRIEPNVMLCGPLIIEDYSIIRSGAYLRGDVLLGSKVVIRGELKNCLIMDQAELCHPGYCGDSLCGFKSHFGNQVTTANLNLFSSSNSRSSSSLNLLIGKSIGGDGTTTTTVFDTGRKKIGVVLGDLSQIGCHTVTDPCTLIQQNTIVYPLTRLNKGIYGPNVIVKNKPMEKGIVQIVPLHKNITTIPH
jgi:hypothetical protein